MDQSQAVAMFRKKFEMYKKITDEKGEAKAWEELFKGYPERQKQNLGKFIAFVRWMLKRQKKPSLGHQVKFSPARLMEHVSVFLSMKERQNKQAISDQLSARSQII